MKPEEAMEIASRVGLTSVYDASRDSYPNWRAKVIEFAKQVAAHTMANIDPSKFMSYQEGIEAGRMAERERIKEEQQRCYVARGEA